MADKLRREAAENIPKGFYILQSNEDLKNDDLVWSWTSREFLRADSHEWKFSPLVYSDDIICAVRRAELSGFQTASRRNFTIRKYY